MAANVHRVTIDVPRFVEQDDGVILESDETGEWVESDSVVVCSEWR